MVFFDMSCLVLVYLLYFVDICMADQRTCTEKNEFISQATNLTTPSAPDHIACKEGHLPAFCIPSDYNMDVGPWHSRHLTNRADPWLFNMEFHIQDIEEIDDEKLTITFDGMFKVKWMEPRCQINVSSDTWKKEFIIVDDEEHYRIPHKNVADLWMPAFEIYHLERYQPQKVLKETANLRINGSKFIRYIVKVKIVLSCKMTFDRYPFDTQACLHQVGSFDYPKEVWDCTSSVNFDASKQRSLQYDINITEIKLSERMYYGDMSGQVWATCGFKIELTRKKGQIFLQVYLTSFMLVVVAWMSFIIPPDVVPGRMGLLVTVFLMLINIFISTKRYTPPSNGFLNAADMFVVACICHVFLGFIEYAFVLFGFGKATMVSALAQTYSTDDFGRHSSQVESTQDNEQIRWPKNICRIGFPDPKQSKRKWNRLDLTLLFAYPLSFATFCMIYIAEYLGD